MVAKLALPMTRLAIMRPATVTAMPACLQLLRAAVVVRRLQIARILRAAEIIRESAGTGTACSRIAASLARRSAISLFSSCATSAAGAASFGPLVCSLMSTAPP